MAARRSRVGHALLLLAVAAAGAPGSAGAQVRRPQAEPGWVGVDAGIVSAPGARPVVIVRRVAEGSPAALAGLAPGDTLVALDGMPPTFGRFQALRSGLRPGDRLEITVRSGARARTLALRAAPRPIDLDLADALRGDAPPLPARLDAPTVVAGSPFGWSVTLPAGTGSDRRTDSLLTRLRERELQLVAVQRAEAERLRALAAAQRVDAARVRAAADELVRTHRARRETLMSEIAELRVGIERLAEQAAAPWSSAGGGPTGWVTPYLVGQDRVAGARLAPLNPGLAQYFGTDRGLLVIEVSPGTPAAAAQLRPGDVLIEVGGLAVDELRALRGAVAASPRERPVPVVLVRRGQRLELELPR